MRSPTSTNLSTNSRHWPIKMQILSRVRVPSRIGTPEYVTFDMDGEDVALCFDGWLETDAPLVRLHSECLTGDVFGSLRCDCQAQLHAAMDIMAAKGGILLYLRQEGRGIGLKKNYRPMRSR